MCMSIFSQSTDEYTHQLVIDIESGSVGGSWVRLNVENTSELGTFKIKKEQSSSKGVRRIKAVLQ